MSALCGACGDGCDKSKALKCAKCQAFFEFQCLNMDKKNFEKMSKTIKSKWLCPNCTPKAPKGDRTHTPIRSLLPLAPELDEIQALKSVKSGATSSPTLSVGDEVNAAVVVSEIRQLREELCCLRDGLENTTAVLNRLCEKIETLDSRIDYCETKIQLLEKRQSETNILKETVSILQEQVELQAQQLLENELEIAGVPELVNENLRHIVITTAQKLGVDLAADELMEVYRAGPRRIPRPTGEGEKQLRPIVVKMVRISKRRELIKAAKSRKNLTTEGIITSGTHYRFFLNERLTKHNRQLFYAARQRSKQLGYKFCWIRNGSIFVRKEEGSAAILIRNSAKLEILQTSTRVADGTDPVVPTAEN